MLLSEDQSNWFIFAYAWSENFWEKAKQLSTQLSPVLQLFEPL